MPEIPAKLSKAWISPHDKNSGLLDEPEKHQIKLARFEHFVSHLMAARLQKECVRHDVLDFTTHFTRS